MQKAALRKLYKEKRNTLTEKQVNSFNDLILIQLQRIELPYVHQVLSYFPMDTHNEPDTFLITRYLKHLNPQVQVGYPRMVEGETMIAVIAHEDSEYEVNHYGINELNGGAVFNPAAIDLILVPMLVCDYKGNRVGYGKGYYDKYLAHCKPSVIKIGLSFFDPVDSIADLQEFDVPLTHCVTPEIVYEF